MLHRLIDVWATARPVHRWASRARLFDELDPLERRKDEIFAEQGVGGGSASSKPCAGCRRTPSIASTSRSSLPIRGEVHLLDSLANVLCPACKLWNTGHGATVMREAVSLMGGYGITEDCPGFLGHKWMDAQLEATYEGRKRCSAGSFPSP